MISEAPIWMTAALLLVVGVAAAWDIRSYTIPNAFPLIVLAMFAVGFPFAGLGFGEFGMHLLSGLAGFIIGYLLFIFGLMGGGDVKLFTAISFWLPITGFFDLVVGVTFAGGILAAVVLLLVWIKRMFEPKTDEERAPLAKTRLPYGVAIFVGTLAVALLGHL